MITGFSKKKIKTEKTLGERFSAARKKLDISLSEAEIGCKVRARYLEALEKGNWKELPSDVYVRGFVLAYAKYLGIEKTEAIRLFEMELCLRKRKKTTDLTYKKNLHDVKVLITPKVLAYGFFSIAILSMFGYITYQVLNFAGRPNLKVLEPGNNKVFETDTLPISGVADNDSVLTVNGELIPISSDGRFTTNLKLHKGVNVVRIQAENRAKKETSEILTIEYKPKTAAIYLESNQ